MILGILGRSLLSSNLKSSSVYLKAISQFTYFFSLINGCLTDLKTALSLGVLLIHDPLLLCPLLLLPAGLGSLLALSVSLFQKILLHPGTIFVSFLFALKINTNINSDTTPIKGWKKLHLSKRRSPLCWDGVFLLCRCCRSPCSWEEAESPCL